MMKKHYLVINGLLMNQPLDQPFLTLKTRPLVRYLSHVVISWAKTQLVQQLTWILQLLIHGTWWASSLGPSTTGCGCWSMTTTALMISAFYHYHSFYHLYHCFLSSHWAVNRPTIQPPKKPAPIMAGLQELEVGEIREQIGVSTREDAQGSSDFGPWLRDILSMLVDMREFPKSWTTPSQESQAL